MSFKINNVTWEPESTQTHTNNIMNKINSLLQTNNVLDKDGKLIQLSANFANALYLLALGCGERNADNDEKLTRAINSFNIELCDDDQIERLLPIASMSRNTGSYSTIDLLCTASGDGDCTIPAGTKAPFKDYNFIVNDTTIISVGSSATIKATCDTLGAIVVLANEIQDFETSIPNLESVINPDSAIVGVNAESTAELRQRLISGNVIKYGVNGVKNALEELTGVAYARVYFNFNLTENVDLEGGVSLPPRCAYIVVHGESDQIAETFAQYMAVDTINSGVARIAKMQNFVSESGQIIPIRYDTAEEKIVYVKIMLKEDAEIGTQVENQLKTDLIASSSDWTIGEPVTSLLTSKPYTNITYTAVAYTLVSEDGITWQNFIPVGCNVIPRVKDSTIEVDQL